MNIYQIVDATKSLARANEEDYEQIVGRKKIIKCALPGCKATTILRRPYCTAHIEHMPYVQALVDKLAVITEDDDAQEILAYLESAELDLAHETPAQRGSYRQIAHRLALPQPHVIRLVEKLAAEGRLQLLKGKRNSYAKAKED